MKCFLLFLPLTIFILNSCKLNDSDAKPETGTGKLIPIDFNDSNFKFQSNYDTILESGWKINYLVKDDSTKYRDIYLKISNQTDSAIYFGDYLLTLPGPFTPSFNSESKDCIFLEHICARDCRAVTVFNKINLKFKDFTYVVDFNASENKVIWIDSEKDDEGEPFKIQISNQRTQNDTTIKFNNLALGSFKQSYIDTVIYGKNRVTVNCTLLDINDYYRKRVIKESKTFSF